MKKTRLFVSIAIIVNLFWGGAQALQAQQQQNNSDAAIRQEIRGLAMQTIQKGYEVYATCSSTENIEQFINLFKNKEAKVYNDLLGLKKGRELTAEQYAQILGGSGVKNIIVNVSGISILDEPYKENGKWKVDVAFNKRMSYYTACGIYFNSNDFYHADYNLEASMVYDEVDKVCFIEGIKGSIDSYEELPEEYFVLKLTDNRDHNLNYRQRPIKFNSGNQALIVGKYDSSAFSYMNPKMNKRLQPAFDEDCLVATMGYIGGKPSELASLLVRPHFDLGLGGLNIDEGDSGIGSSSSNLTFGVDFGLPLMATDKLTLNGFAGIGLNISSIDLDYDRKGIIGIPVEKDIDDDPYTRYYENVSMSQNFKLTELSVPVYLDAEMELSSGLALYGDLGLRFNFNMGSSADINSAKAKEVYGIYPKYGDLKLDGNWGFNDFGNNKELSAIVNDPDGISGMTFDIIGGAGLRYYIPDSPVGIDLGVRFQLGMSEIVKPDIGSEGVINNSNNSGNTVAIINKYDDGKEQVISLTDMLTSVKRNALALSIGLIFKF